MRVLKLLTAVAAASVLWPVAASAQENPVQIQHGNEYGIVSVPDYVALLPKHPKRSLRIRRSSKGQMRESGCSVSTIAFRCITTWSRMHTS